MHRLRLLLLAVTLAGSLSAQTTYLSNTANATINGIYVFDTQWLGRAFTTAASGGGYELNSIDLSFHPASGTDAAFTASLWSNSGGMPGTSVATFTTPANGAHFDLAGGYALASGSTYWLVVSSTTPVNTSVNRVWGLSSDTSNSASPGWTFGASASSADSGANWSAIGPNFQLAVNATELSAVPEPSTYAAFAGFAALGLVAWRRRQARV